MTPELQPVGCHSSLKPRPSGLSKNSVLSKNHKFAFRPPRSRPVMSDSDIVGPRPSTNCSILTKKGQKISSKNQSKVKN